MAKKGGKKGKKGKKQTRQQFAEAMTRGPSGREYRNYERSQQRRFNPLIRELRRQSEMTPAMDPRVRELERQMSAERSVEDIQGAYQGGLDRFGKALSGVDFAAMGRGVTGAISGLGEALGVEGAADIGEAAGRVSGIGEGQDIFSKAILGGVTSRFKELETGDIRDRANRLQQMGLSKAEALKEARQELRNTRLQLAQTLGERLGSAPDPLERAMKFMQFNQMLRDYTGSGGYGGGYGGGSESDTNPPPPPPGVSPFMNIIDVEGTSGGMSSYYPGSTTTPVNTMGRYSRPSPRRKR